MRLTCKCVCLYVESVLRSEDYDQSLIKKKLKIGSFVCLHTPVSLKVPEMEGIYATGDILFLNELMWPSGKVLGW